jgi:hypothetical protein
LNTQRFTYTKCRIFRASFAGREFKGRGEVRERERERNAPSAARRHSASATLCHAVAMVGTAPGTQVVRHIDASGLCTTHRCIRLVHDTSMHHACVRHIDASCLFTTHRCIMLVYDTSMHHACLRHIDASCLCTTHRCIRLVTPVWMDSAMSVD